MWSYLDRLVALFCVSFCYCLWNASFFTVLYLPTFLCFILFFNSHYCTYFDTILLCFCSLVHSVFIYIILLLSNMLHQRLRWSRVSVLVFGTQVRRFKSGRSRRIFQDEKILSTPSFGREIKPFFSCRRFTACKISLNVTWKSGILRQNSSAIYHLSSSSFHY